MEPEPAADRLVLRHDISSDLFSGMTSILPPCRAYGHSPIAPGCRGQGPHDSPDLPEVSWSSEDASFRRLSARGRPVGGGQAAARRRHPLCRGPGTHSGSDWLFTGSWLALDLDLTPLQGGRKGGGAHARRVGAPGGPAPPLGIRRPGTRTSLTRSTTTTLCSSSLSPANGSRA